MGRIGFSGGDGEGLLGDGFELDGDGLEVVVDGDDAADDGVAGGFGGEEGLGAWGDVEVDCVARFEVAVSVEAEECPGLGDIGGVRGGEEEGAAVSEFAGVDGVEAFVASAFVCVWHGESPLFAAFPGDVRGGPGSACREVSVVRGGGFGGIGQKMPKKQGGSGADWGGADEWWRGGIG